MKSKGIIAYCWPSGIIEFGDTVPYSALAIVSGPSHWIRVIIQRTAVLAMDGKTFLVPGIPEAMDAASGLAALEVYIRQVKRMRDGEFHVMTLQ